MNNLSGFIDILMSRGSNIYSNESMEGDIARVDHEKYFNIKIYQQRLNELGFDLKLNTIQTTSDITLEVTLSSELNRIQILVNKLANHFQAKTRYEVMSSANTVNIYSLLAQRLDVSDDWNESHEDVHTCIVKLIEDIFNEKVLSEAFIETMKVKYSL